MKLIPLTKGKFAKVDDVDYDFLMQWKWIANEVKQGHWYAMRGKREPKIGVGQYGKVKVLMMHRVIMGLTERHKKVVDPFNQMSGGFPKDQDEAPQWLKEINDDFRFKTEMSLADLNDNRKLKFEEIGMLLEAVYIYKVLD